MRIDGNKTIPEPPLTENSTAKAGKASQPSSGEDASAGVSADSSSLSALTAQAMATPEVRQDRVDALRDAVRNGNYLLDPLQIANAMLREAS